MWILYFLDANTSAGTGNSMKNYLFKSLSQWPFQKQLALLFTLSVVFFASTAVLINYWNERSRDLNQLMRQATLITNGFSRKNILTFLYGVNDNTVVDANAVLQYPDVWQVSIHDKNNLIILQRGEEVSKNLQVSSDSKPFTTKLIYEDDIAWHFIAAVYTVEKDVKDISPFDIHESEAEYLGFVHISFNKSGMNARQTEKLRENILGTLLFSIVLLVLILWLTSRMTRPLNILSELMKKAEHGEYGVRAAVSGSLEINNMTHAFNSMMRELESKASSLDEKNILLVNEIEEKELAEAQQHELQKQLQQAQKMEAIGQLTGGIAHDFNNMLASIMGYTNLAQERFGHENEKLNEYLSEVNLASERARDLIAQMLAFSRGGSNQSRMMDLKPLVKDAIKMLSSTMPSSVEVQTDFLDGLPMIMMDPVQMHQIVMNLCINARDAMMGNGELIVTLKNVEFTQSSHCISCIESINGNYVELNITDTGQGIDPNLLRRVFDPFFTTKDIGKGTGMGLSMVHGIVHEHGGHILVDSIVNKGTTFRLLFPSLQEKIVQTNETLLLPITAKITTDAIPHILVVDDEVSVAKFLREYLEVQGFTVTLQTDSKSALALFRKRPEIYDLVVTDQIMPDLSGMELSKEMLALRPNIPIIICSAYDAEIDEYSVKKIGVRKYISKPVNPTVLLKTIGDLVETSQQVH